MANRTRQVQHKRHARSLAEPSPEELRALEEGIKAIEAQAEAEGYPLFLSPGQSIRHYPGEAEAFHILQQIVFLKHSRNRKKLGALLKVLRVLQNYEVAVNSGDSRAVAKAVRGARVVQRKLERTIQSGRILVIDTTKKGPVIEPGTTEGMTAVALLSLLRQGKLHRLRQCRHCGTWFFARFKHKRFCDSPTKCQWNHYHPPEWRGQHRERNKKHQQEYRDRLFGSRKRKIPKRVAIVDVGIQPRPTNFSG